MDGRDKHTYISYHLIHHQPPNKAEKRILIFHPSKTCVLVNKVEAVVAWPRLAGLPLPRLTSTPSSR